MEEIKELKDCSKFEVANLGNCFVLLCSDGGLALLNEPTSDKVYLCVFSIRKNAQEYNNTFYKGTGQPIQISRFSQENFIKIINNANNRIALDPIKVFDNTKDNTAFGIRARMISLMPLSSIAQA